MNHIETVSDCRPVRLLIFLQLDVCGSRPKFDILRFKKSIANELPSTIIYLKLLKIKSIFYTKVLQINTFYLKKMFKFGPLNVFE